jgi:hypothetical protein
MSRHTSSNKLKHNSNVKVFCAIVSNKNEVNLEVSQG